MDGIEVRMSRKLMRMKMKDVSHGVSHDVDEDGYGTGNSEGHLRIYQGQFPLLVLLPSW